MSPAAAPGLRTVVLDLDDTLLASARARARARAHVRKAYGIAGNRRLDRHMVAWWHRFEAGEISMEEMRTRRWTELGVPVELAAEVDLAYRGLASAANLRRGVRRLLTGLRARGLKTVVLTNGPAPAERPELAGMLRLFDAGLRAESPRHKPHPEAFAEALALVGARPAEAAMVGDTLVADIEGALAAGFARAVWVVRRHVEHPDPRVIPVTSLDQVLPALSFSPHG